MKKQAAILSLLLIISAFFTGCNQESSTANQKSGTITVYTTIFPLKDFAEKIGGNYVDVEAIYPAGADSHTYEPSQKQIVNIAKADLFVYNGAELEPFVDKLETSLEKEKVTIVNASEGLPLITSSEEEEEHGAEEEHGTEEEHEETEEHHHDQDPHVWLDPSLAAQQAEIIKNALVKLQPAHKDEFEKNYEILKKQLNDLDKEFQTAVNNAKTKELLVSHAAYGYWEHRYGIKQIAIAGLSASQEPSQKKLAEIAKLAKEHQLQYILFETFATPKVAEVVQKETGTKVLRLNHLATISEEDAKKNKDYITLMKENLETLKKAMNP